MALLVCAAPKGDAQRCGTGRASESASSTQGREKSARANVDLLFEGIAIGESEKKRAVTVLMQTYDTLVKLDWQAPDYQEKFTKLATERNARLLKLAKTAGDTAKLVNCFRILGQPSPIPARGK